MQIKNKIFLIITLFLSTILFTQTINADEFDISATEILIDKDKDILTGIGSVEAIDSEGKIIKADKIIYYKSKEYLEAEGSVIISDSNGNILTTDKASYDKKKELIISSGSSILNTSNGYILKTNEILYDNTEKIISSNTTSFINDADGNVVEASMFQYYIEKNLISSVGSIKIVDIKKNIYTFKELHIDTIKKEIIGSEVSALLDQENFGLKKNNDPRFVSNDVFISKDKSIMSKGVFTVCKQDGDKCPPWSLQAKKIEHDKIKKTIYYENAILKVYDVPIFYFPRFYHPDPTVKRQSGFLNPFFSDSTSVGTGFGIPYYWAVSDNKDVTFTPKFYQNENMIFLNEYRQAFKNSFLTLDTSYTEGYKNTSSTKTDGSRNHIFANLDIDLGKDKSYESNLSLKIQKTSNDTYFRIHDINTGLVDAENTNLKNEINYSLNKNSMFVEAKVAAYEDLREDDSSRYEYIFPDVMFGNSFFNEKLGVFNLTSNATHKNYNVNNHLTSLTNDVVWTPNSFITSGGIVNAFSSMLRNNNYDAVNTKDYKTKGTINELSGVVSFKSSLPLQKKGANFTNTFSPNFMLRYAPGHMRNLGGDDVSLNYSNLYSMNKTSEIEKGLNAILGVDFKMNEKNEDGLDEEKLSISLGQVFSHKRNKDIPVKSSLDQKMSDVVGEISYNFSEISKIDYKFSVDHNLNDINYSEISTILNFGKVSFNLDYLEEQNHIGNEHYVNSGINLSVNENNKLSFQTKKNFKTDSTELYDISYQYLNDCLTAGLVFRREFYEDNDVQPKDTLMFKITFVPFTGAKAPLINK